jgi:hypothetical protein
MLVNQNRVLLVVIAVAIGCLVNMPQMKLKDPMMKAGVFAVCLYVAYWFLNSQGLVEGWTIDAIAGVLPSKAQAGLCDLYGRAWDTHQKKCTRKCHELAQDGNEAYNQANCEKGGGCVWKIAKDGDAKDMTHTCPKPVRVSSGTKCVYNPKLNQGYARCNEMGEPALWMGKSW